jgi:hypothetical protein
VLAASGLDKPVNGHDSLLEKLADFMGLAFADH